MAGFQVDRRLIFAGDDLTRPRMAVEQEKLRARFPGFRLYGTEDRVTAVKGYLSTTSGREYYVSIEILGDYPYSIPVVNLPIHRIDPRVHHRFSDHKPCVMRADQWSVTLSLAFMVAKAAVWLDKYETWKRDGAERWPGRAQYV